MTDVAPPTTVLEARLGTAVGAEVLERALTHRSYAYENGGLPTNERLEFLGDSVLGLVVTDTLYRTHPDLPEGQLAKLRAAVVNMRALAEVGRGLDLGAFVRLGRGEEATGRSRQVLDPRRHGRGGDRRRLPRPAARGRVRARAPARRPADRRGRGTRRRAGLEDLAAGDDRRSRPRRPRVRRDRGPGPTTRRPSAPTYGSPRQVFGSGTGRSKKEAEQEAAVHGLDGAARALDAEGVAAEPGRRLTRALTSRRAPCLSFPRSRSSAAVFSASWAAAPSARSTSCTREPYAVTRRAPPTWRASWSAGASCYASRRGKYLWLPLEDDGPGAALVAHLGMSGQLLVQPPGTRRRAPTCAYGCASTTAVPSCGSSTSARSAASRSSRSSRTGEGHVPRSVAHIARDPLDPDFDDGGVLGSAAPQALRASSAPCSTRHWSRAWATSTPTRRCGTPGCTSPGPPRR